MRPMDKQDVGIYRRRLIDLRWMLSRDYWKEREASRQEGKPEPQDLVDLAVRSYTRDYLISLSEMDRKQLFLIEDALGRIERGEYGACSHCGSGIPRSRLDAVPWARLCIVCQGLQEEGILPRWTFSVPPAAAKVAGSKR
ncbi:MAG TPA: TraR/DksA C4-type zinc finger protein [Candidatus Polarisedimenticolia bacterium]|nr:TraR/DksA C4-type zinc finger protein [Candidatus Polarisedimenticolia bacterium]